jgi:hypothetical protein
MKQTRFFEVSTDQILVGCIGCGLTKDSSEFYVKYKALPPTSVSHWQEKCRTCAKTYRNRHYRRHAKKINAARKSAYYANHEQELQKIRDRNLEKSSNPGRLKRRRAVQAMDSTTRYIHDRCTQWKAQAARRGLAWNIDESWVRYRLDRQQGLCFYTKKPLVLESCHRETLSVDRVDSKLGYTPDNVVLCGALINKMKLDLSMDEFITTVDILYRNLPSGDED